MSHAEAHAHDGHEEEHHGHDDHGHHDKDDHGHNGHEKEDHAHAAADHAPAASATTKSESKSESPKSGGSTVNRIWNNTRNFLRNTFAGGILATTVSTTDTIENVSTAITRPTGNILKTIENTADAIGKTFQKTTTWNVLHSMANTLTLPFRAAGSVVEWSVNALGGVFQYASAWSQVFANSLETTAQDMQQTFSTSNESPDIPHKKIDLKDAPSLRRNGGHGVVWKNHTPSKSWFMRWAGNVIKAPLNAVTNVARVATDTVSAVAQRARWVVESVEWVAKGIKKSRSWVFTKWQSWRQKTKNIFTQGIRWSVKSVAKWVWNIVNEWVFKTGFATAGIVTNLVGRTLGNTIAPLVSSKSNHKDNIFQDSKAFKRLTARYTTTPRWKNVEAETTDAWWDHKADHTHEPASAHPEAKHIAHAVAVTPPPAWKAKKEESGNHGHHDTGNHGHDKENDAHAHPGGDHTQEVKKVDHKPSAAHHEDHSKDNKSKDEAHGSHEAEPHKAEKKDEHPTWDHKTEAQGKKKDEPHKPDDKHDTHGHKDGDKWKWKPEAKEAEKSHDTHTHEAKKDNNHGTKGEKAWKTEAEHDHDDKHPEQKEWGHDEPEAKAEPAHH